MMKRSNAMIGQEVVEYFKKCKLTTQDYILNLAQNISNYSEFETFMMSLKDFYQIKVYRTPNDECVTIIVNEELFCSMVQDPRFFNEFFKTKYLYDEHNKEFWDFLLDIFDKLNWEYLDKISIPIQEKYFSEPVNLLLKAYYLEPSTDNIPSN